MDNIIVSFNVIAPVFFLMVLGYFLVNYTSLADDTVRIIVSDRSKDRNTGKSAGCSYPGNFPEQLCDLRSCSRTEYVWIEKYDDSGNFKCHPGTDV